MSKLTSKTRNKLPTSSFAGPDRSYPVDTKGRAANAKARATQQVNKGNLSPATASKIKAKANKVLGKDSTAGRMKKVKTDRGDFTFKANRKGE